MIIMKILFGIFGLSIVVIVHEAGHFIAARLSGIKVEAFSIGWGKVLYSRMWKETEFRISLFPLGGYCKMQGEQAMIQAWETKAKTIDTDEGDMYAASWWKRIIVSLSGPFMNLIFAAIIFFVISFAGYNIHYYPSRIVLASDYTERSDYPADKAELQSGDLITAVNGKEIERFDQLQEMIVIHPDEVITLTVKRDSKLINMDITPELNKENGAGYMGIYPWIDPVIREFSEESLLRDSGALAGDRILAINSIPIINALDVSSSLKEGELVQTMSLMRNNKKILIEIPGGMEISRSGINFDYLTYRTPSFKLFSSFKNGAIEAWETSRNSVKGLSLLFKGINLQSAVSGPLRITYMTGDLAFSGFKSGIGEGLLIFFRFIALINIALFVMNLLPIPVLDGGQILLFLAEGLFRKKPNPAVLYRYQMLGTMIVFALIIFATMNDILFFSRN
jgi:regulator of sigma E protease